MRTAADQLTDTHADHQISRRYALGIRSTHACNSLVIVMIMSCLWLWRSQWPIYGVSGR